MNQPQRVPPWQLPDDGNRIDINLIAMLLWQSLLTGVSVTVSHLNWYLPEASPAEMGLQYGLIAFGFLCVAMVLFHVGGIRDSLALRAEFAQEGRYDKWHRSQMRLQQRRMRKDYQMQQDIDMYKQQSWQKVTNPAQQTFGLPNDGEEPKSENEQQ
tara:strand:+ start:689 stop:1156 length:468 start_codon:yes stop_codon:yes gene_type:complete